jgi:hypothetical protein
MIRPFLKDHHDVAYINIHFTFPPRRPDWLIHSIEKTRMSLDRTVHELRPLCIKKEGEAVRGVLLCPLP